MTNFEKIKGMSEKQLAEWLNDICDCKLCAHRNNSCACAIEEHCYLGIKEWLESEVEK